MARRAKSPSLKPFSYYDLLDAFVLSGCPVCRLLQIDADRFLQLILREATTDPAVHQRLRASLGLCNLHAWQMRDYKGWASGVAVLQESVLHELLARLREARPNTVPNQLRTRLRAAGPGDQAARKLAAQQRCQCCDLMDQAEARYAQTIAAHFADSDMQEAYRASDGLCLPHFRLLLERLTDPALVTIAVEAQIRKWESLKAEIDLFLRNLDGQRLGEPTGAEGDSWIRAIHSIMGERGIFGQQRKRD